MSLLNELEKEYKTYSGFEKVEQELIKKRNVFPINEIENRLKYRLESDKARDNKIESLIKITDLAKNVYISSIGGSDNSITFKISNYFVQRQKEFHNSFGYQILYTLRYIVDKNNQGSFKTYFETLPSDQTEIATMVSVVKNSDKFNHGIYRKSSTDLESFGDFIKNSGESFSKNIIDILQLNEKRELLIHITQSHNLSKFQNAFKKLLIEMEEILSVKSYEQTFKAIGDRSEGDKRYIINVLQNLDRNYQTNKLNQVMVVNEIAKSKKMKI